VPRRVVEPHVAELRSAAHAVVERYWHHTQLLLDTAATGSDAAALCRNVDSEAAREA
jgi:hypothetical protein